MPVYILECVYLLMLSLSPPHSQGHRKVWLLCVCPVAFSIAGQIPVKFSLLLCLLLGTTSAFHLRQSPWPLAFLS